MVRSGTIVVVLLALAAAILGQRSLGGSQDDDAVSAEIAYCYPLRETCRWQTPGGEAALSMEQLADDELTMSVTLPGVDERVMVLLSGESMYMGEYPLMLQQTEQPSRFRVRFTPPFCSTGDNMVWKVNLRVGREPLASPYQLLFTPD